MKHWIWKRTGWTDFHRHVAPLRPLEDQFLHLSGVAIGSIHFLSEESKASIRFHLIEEEAVETSLIEGEVLDRASVQSSLRRNLDLASTAPTRTREQAIADLMASMVTTFVEPLDHATLYGWHQRVVVADQVKDVGTYRTNSEDMEVVSGPDYRRVSHYTAPPSRCVPAEMEAFVGWFNESRGEMPALARSAVAHLWFETIHPFEDGNGRIGRAISQKALGQAISSAPIAMLSEMITRNKNRYYDTLNAAQAGGDPQDWISYFSEISVAAQERTIERIRFIAAKTNFLDTFSAQLNDRQRKAVVRIFAEGPDGFKGGLSAANYRTITDASVPTTTRDLNDLVRAGILRREGELRYARYYLAL